MSKAHFEDALKAAKGDLAARKLNEEGVLPSASEVFDNLPSAAPAEAAPSVKPGKGGHLEKFYAAFPHTRGQRPSQPHATIDPDGTARDLTVTQKAQNVLAQKAADEYDALEQARKDKEKEDKDKGDSGRGSSGGSGTSGRAPRRPESILKNPSPSSVPTNKTPGVHVPQQMGIKEFETHINALKTMLGTHLATLQSVKLRPEAEAYAGIAENHLKDATKHLKNAETARKGVIVGGKRMSGDAEAGKHYISALNSLRAVHDNLATDDVTQAVHVHKLTAELPTSHLEMLESAADTIPILKKGKSFKTIPIGRQSIDPNVFNIKGVEQVVGKSSPVVAKIKAGQRGTPRQDKFRVVTGQEEQVIGGLPGAGDRVRGRNGMVSTPINPKRKASRQRNVEDRLPNANMSRFKTPTFGEKGSSGVQKNPGSAGPLNPKKYEGRDSRGGKGGAV